jgi:hypothetical protein
VTVSISSVRFEIFLSFGSEICLCLCLWLRKLFGDEGEEVGGRARAEREREWN